MEKLMTLVRRAPGLDRAAFFDAYRNRDVPSRAKTQPLMRGHVVSLADLPPEDVGLRPGGGEPAFDAIEEFWFENLADYRPVAADGALIGEWHTYQVREFIERDFDRSWPDGARSPGVKAFYFARRRDGLSHDQFAAYWGEKHAPLALVRHIGMWRYKRNVVTTALSDGAPDWDGFAELHFRTAQDFREKFYDSDEGRQAIGEDVAKFSGPGRALYTTEHILQTP